MTDQYAPLFGHNLLVALDACGMSRAQLGQATNGNFVDAWIDGSRDPSLAELARLRAVLDVDLNWLITGFGAPPGFAAGGMVERARRAYVAACNEDRSEPDSLGTCIRDALAAAFDEQGERDA